MRRCKVAPLHSFKAIISPLSAILPVFLRLRKWGLMPKIEVNEEICKGCTLCVAACPQKILRPAERINASGYHPIEIFEPEKCKGCAFCAMMCPDVAITVYR